jgi:hypothetical protein
LCSDDATLRAGDTIKVRDELGVRTLTMPLVTLVVNRVTDVLRGRGPANSDGYVYWHAGLYADFYHSQEISSDAEGRWSFAPEEEDIIGGINAEAEWTSPKGDRYFIYGVAPYVQVTLGRAGVSGGASPGQSVLFKLRDPSTATLKGTAEVVGDEYGSLLGQFESSQGQPTPVLAGNRVLSKVASDLDWIVPNVELTANVASDLVSGRCASTDINPLFVEVSVYRTGVQRGFALDGIEPDGTFAIDFDQPPDMFFDPANIKHGDRIEARCVYDTGDIVRLVTRVP